ncbi:DUF418 domain-containing protein [Streptomyces sp. MBT65]|uniref:DUF418 domain-containing protein n=1 Tax=Streptomyces sp. MBT65 TaxID=1488395 RepID=UPI0027DA414C|nr:DUF418 domain-containing protein [Streptomyces sp. MBT65]
MAVCVQATVRLPRLTRPATPVTAVGMIALTAYVLYDLAIRAVGMKEETGPALLSLFLFTTSAILCATAWTRHFRRGPLEYLLYAPTRPTRSIR